MRPYPTLTRPSEIDADWAMSILEQAGYGPCFKVTRKEALLNDGNPNACYQCGLAGNYYTLSEIRKWAFRLFSTAPASS